MATYNKELLDLYKLGLKLNIILDNGKISEGDFVNIISVGCFEKEYKWVEKFIETHEKYLDDMVREDAKAFGLGRLYYRSGNFDRALDILGQHSFVNVFYIIQSKVDLVRIWFEKFLIDVSLYDLLLAQLEAFEKSIRRNRSVAEIKKEEILNFILGARKMANLILHKKTKKKSSQL